MKMIKTKVTKRNNYYVVQLADELGKYKQVAKFNNESFDFFCKIPKKLILSNLNTTKKIY